MTIGHTHGSDSMTSTADAEGKNCYQRHKSPGELYTSSESVSSQNAPAQCLAMCLIQCYIDWGKRHIFT